MSVNTPEYSSDPDVIVNPDITGVSGVPLKFWKRSGNNILEMTQAEKDAVNAAELQAKKDAVTIGYTEMKSVMTALIKVINLRLPAGQKITAQEMIDAIKVEVT